MLGSRFRQNISWVTCNKIFSTNSLSMSYLNSTESTIQLGVPAQAYNSLRNAETHFKLAFKLKGLGRLKEAESNYRQAIALRPDLPEAHNNLGHLLQELNRWDEAEQNIRQALALRPEYADAHFNLGKALHVKGDIDLALESLKKASEINPESRQYGALLNILTSRKYHGKNSNTANDAVAHRKQFRLPANPLISSRPVEQDLISNLSSMGTREMDSAQNTPVFGNGRCSLGYNTFTEDYPFLRTLEQDLSKAMKEAVNSEIYVVDSFFNIYGPGAGIHPHTHLNELDEDEHFCLWEQKFSLIYYLSVGDQSCNKPGILKLYDPNEDILPREGMIVVFPASRKHSAIYSGKKDRIMVGVNFYSL